MSIELLIFLITWPIGGLAAMLIFLRSAGNRFERIYVSDVVIIILGTLFGYFTIVAAIILPLVYLIASRVSDYFGDSVIYDREG